MEKEILRKSFIRSLEPIGKGAYADGAADGQKSVFQLSFDSGYAEGIDFCIKLSSTNTLNSLKQNYQDIFAKILDPLKLNCQICLDSTLQNRTVSDILNIQVNSNSKVLNVIAENTPS